jgi:plastocyanin
LILVVLLVLVAGPTFPTPVIAAEVQVDVTTTLEPQHLTVAPNTTVTWTNLDGDRHRIRATGGPAEFDSGNLEPGEEYSFTFTEEGVYPYRDERNPDLTSYHGIITVQAEGSPGGDPSPAGTNEVGMANRTFRPVTLTIQVGETVTWINDDGRDHTVTARDRSFDSGIMTSGALFEWTFTQPGTYEYFCALHPDMVGTIFVEGAGGVLPPPAPEPDPAPVPGTGDISIIDFSYGPAVLTVPAGSSVTWVNEGVALHTVTARDGSFDSGLMATGDSFTRTFTQPGTYEYFCTLHPGMIGTLVVTGPGGEAPPPPEPPPPPPPVPAAPGDLRIVDFAYRPASIEITPGTTLRWVNQDVAPHTVTDRAGRFDSGIMATGDTFSFTFTQPGTYEYFCTLHPEMTATVVVRAPGGGEVPPPEPPLVTQDPVDAPHHVAVAGEVTVDMLDNEFGPTEVTVPAGTTVLWVNRGLIPHTATALSGSFDSGIILPGETFAVTLDTAGTYEYHCTLHPGMTGTVVVEEAPVGGPPVSSEHSVSTEEIAAGQDPSTSSPSETANEPTNAMVALFGLAGLGFAAYTAASFVPWRSSPKGDPA